MYAVSPSTRMLQVLSQLSHDTISLSSDKYDGSFISLAYLYS